MKDEEEGNRQLVNKLPHLLSHLKIMLEINLPVTNNQNNKEVNLFKRLKLIKKYGFIYGDIKVRFLYSLNYYS